MPDMMGRLSTARMKYAAALSTKYIAPACASDVNILVASTGTCANVHAASITYGHSQDSYQQSCHQNACKNGFCHLQESPPATTGH